MMARCVTSSGLIQTVSPLVFGAAEFPRRLSHLPFLRGWAYLFVVIDIAGWGLSPRGAGFLFGADITKHFAHRNAIDLIARAHQLAMEGYKLMFDQTIVTVWSAPNYCYRYVLCFVWNEIIPPSTLSSFNCCFASSLFPSVMFCFSLRPFYVSAIALTFFWTSCDLLFLFYPFYCPLLRTRETDGRSWRVSLGMPTRLSVRWFSSVMLIGWHCPWLMICTIIHELMNPTTSHPSIISFFRVIMGSACFFLPLPPLFAVPQRLRCSYAHLRNSPPRAELTD